MLGIRPFQIVLLLVFVFIFLASIGFLAFYHPEDNGPKITRDMKIWGTFDAPKVRGYLSDIQDNNLSFSRVSYKQFDEDEFVSEFVNAVAEGRGPDLLLISNELLVELRPKLYALSYEFYPQRTFQDIYTEGAQIFGLEDGIYALPFAVDPLVMYWNRDIFSSNQIALPPKTWEEVRNSTVPALTRTGGVYDVMQSAIAFGEYANVRQAKAILSLLLIQSGSSIVVENNDRYSMDLSGGDGATAGYSPYTAALTFYTEFANPASSLYSWNRSLPEDRSRFLSGDLALYFDYASAYTELSRANPNLNFDMTVVPQSASAAILRDYGKFYGVAIPYAAYDKNMSYVVAERLVRASSIATLLEPLELAPVHRSLLAEGTTDAYDAVRYRAALNARGWLEPDQTVVDEAFATMVSDVTSGRLGATQALSNAEQRLRNAF